MSRKITKPKNPKPVKPRPVLAWCVVDRTRPFIMPGWCAETRCDAVEWTSAFHSPDIIRVEIRPAPARKAKRGGK